jgi:hypothetical protein
MVVSFTGQFDLHMICTFAKSEHIRKFKDGMTIRTDLDQAASRGGKRIPEIDVDQRRWTVRTYDGLETAVNWSISR